MKEIELFKVMMTPNKDKLLSELSDVLYSGRVAEGPKVKEFEKKLCEYIGNDNGVIVNSCTSALLLSLRACDVGPGDEVITTPLTCVATNEPIISLGAKIVWADIEEDTGKVSAKTIKDKITNKTKAIIVMHKEGDIIDLEPISKFGIPVIEDAAHAFGGEYKGQKIGNYSDFVCFSFQSIKQLTSVDGGIIFCKNKENRDRLKAMRYFGIDRDKRNFEQNVWDYDIIEYGYKANMNEISAIIGLNNLSVYDNTLNTFIDNGKKYLNELQDFEGISHIRRFDDVKSTFWTFCMLVDKKDDFINMMRSKGVKIGFSHIRNDNYKVFEDFKIPLPGVDAFTKKEVSLPCHVEEDEFRYIIDCIKEGW